MKDAGIDDIVLVDRFPGVEDYRRMRIATGLSDKSVEAATRGLDNTIYGVSLLRILRPFDRLRTQDKREEVVGMGRIVGDDGCFYFVVDIAVDPALQGRGLGKRIMSVLDVWLKANAPHSAHVGLFADGDAKHLYEKYGFVETKRSVGMSYRA